MVLSVTGDQLKQAFQQPLEDEVLNKCVELCNQLNLSVDDFNSKWDAYCLNLSIQYKQTDIKLTQDELPKFKNYVAREQKAQAKSLHNSLFTKKTKPVKIYSKDTIDELQDIYSGIGVDISESEFKQTEKLIQKEEEENTAKKQKLLLNHDNNNSFNSPIKPVPAAVSIVAVSSPVPASPTPKVNWNDRPNKGKVEQTFNEQLSKNPEIDVEESVDVALETKTSQQFPYRYMNDKIIDKAKVLDQRVSHLATSFVDALQDQLTEKIPGLFQLPSQDNVLAVGKISTEVEGKLTADGTVVLESTDDRGRFRVRLGLHGYNDDYSLFPGQVIVTEGTNPSGKLFLAKKLLEGAPLPFLEDAPSFPPFSVIVACGPWTTDDNLNFEALDSLLTEIELNSVELAILIGPFVDSQHPIVESGDIADSTFEEVFQSMVSKKIATMLEDKGSTTKFVIIPSLQDVTHAHFVFPQPPFNANELGIPKEVLLFPNPCTFVVNGTSIGVVSHDVLRDFMKESDCHKSKPGALDRVGKLCEHIINQRSYYPIFPPSPGVNLDSTRLAHIDLPYTPDILIVPSQFKYFVKNVKDVLCINPGRVTRGFSAGTYARFTIHPKTEEQPRAVQRSRVDVIRL